MNHKTHQVDFCVVGGGLAGLCAAIAAARHGAKVILMHDRPVLGGNASSECRIHICGADRHNGIKNMRETGILEELRLENLLRNPQRSFSVQDLIFHEFAQLEKNLTLLLNCSCLEAEMDGDRISSVTGWQLTTETRHTVSAEIFADCSGEGILAPLTGAEFRIGREASSEFNEAAAPEKADKRTMGMSCLFQAREYPSPQPFTPAPGTPAFPDCKDLPGGAGGHREFEMGYWWVELGGEDDSIHDTEALRDRLLPITLGVWDHIKNHCPMHREAATNWALDWLQFLPGKRESRRFVGDHILSQNEILAGGKFEDIVAYGGWSMDDHHPAGFHAVKLNQPPTIFHPAPSPYGIPWRCLYSKNIRNLAFAGRNISATHIAMSSTRVMGTGAAMGQAVGTAAAMAVKDGLLLRDITGRAHELQQILIRDDCYLPGIAEEIPEIMRNSQLSASQGDPEPLRDGINRPVEENIHAWEASPGDSILCELPQTARITEISLILDTGMDQNLAMSYHCGVRNHLRELPATMPTKMKIEIRQHESWHELAEIENPRRRRIEIPVNMEIDALRVSLIETRGAASSRIYALCIR